MPRTNRIQPAGIHHVTARGCMRMPIFGHRAARGAFLDRVAIALEGSPVRIISYCVMPNHVHLLVKTEDEGDLSDPLREILGAFAAWYKAKYGHEGHVFERRFRSVPCESDRHIDEACRYIAMNPVRAKLAPTALEYPWSSFPQNIGLAEPRPFMAPDWMRERFAVLGTWPDEFIAFVHREDAPADLAPFEDARCVALMEDPSLECMVWARLAGLSVRKIAKVVGVAPATAARHIRAEMKHSGRGP
jgi:putative transposase